MAAQSTTTFNVTATVAATCTVAATNMGFGTVNVLSGSNVDTTSTITVTCTNGTTYSIGLNPGTGSGATVSDRKMTSGGDTLNYGLFTDSNRSTNWDDIGGTNVGSGTGSGSGQAHTVYGRVPLGQTTVPPGSYSDTITVTVEF